ncbi:efflux RND transporter periplasmic adaptor subunit [Duganella sp. Root198D2]|uniref:efflux RND transporter periplasmic adaptor subunit n=1 Tax=Duganella sp. Root198D2 TaxID=1736489 RepID=UPI00070982E8|nr:efflux RND transporter periplasmic adaptor subunit [Duganella sp. Root198D2]KRB81633.1 secretion protein HlyD [Duganella sp. Root198D2]
METPITSNAPSKPRASKRARWIGGVAALAGMLVLGGLAWYLTHRGPGEGGPGGSGTPAAAAGAGAAGQGGGRGGRGGRGPAATVGVATAEKADLPLTLDALGTVTAAATTTVRPQVSGILQKVLFKEGQMVKAGQVLAQIDPRQFELQLMQATGQRERDEAQLENARLTLERYRTLLSQDSIARQDVDTQAALVKQLQGTVTTDRANEGTARLNLGYTKVVAPISGRVGLRVVDIGNLVGSSDAAGIAVITQLAPIDVEFAVPQDRVSELAPRTGDGAGASMVALAYDRTRSTVLEKGVFYALDNQVDTQTGTVMAKARFANAGSSLFPSQFVNVRLELRTIKGAVVVPVTALRHGSSGDYVYVLQDGQTASLRQVKRGIATVDKVQVESGLAAGEQVITEGADRIKDGARVTLPSQRPGADGEHSGRARREGRAGGNRGDAAAGGAASAAVPTEGGVAGEGGGRGRRREGRAADGAAR